MPKLSRTKIASYFAGELANGKRDSAERLAALLVDTHRTGELDLIVADIETELTSRGIILADVTTAHEGGDYEAQVRSLTHARPSDTVIVREHVDPTLIGGIKVSVGGRELDASISRKLNLLKASAA